MRLLLLVVALLAVSCAGPAATPKGSIAVTFALTSSAFDDGASIPSEYTCDAGGTQLPIAWSGAPAGTAEFALTMDDPDANGFVHWVVTGIPADSTSLGGSLPAGATAGQPYRGPCPPSGVHHYVLTLYALSAPLGSSPGSAAQVKAATADKTLATAQLTGTYTRE
jgi:Raf kinase inhibitor-like YbhB/YbcL family protein